MSPRARSVFFCTECGNDTPRWQGQCPSCEAWNTLVEEKVTKPGKHAASATNGAGATRRAPIALADVGGETTDRWSSGIRELDFVLGGGVVPGSVVLIGGEPGIGKSTLLLQAAAQLLAAGHPVLYVTGEESAGQVRMRSDRLTEPTAGVRVLAETDLLSILASASEEKPAVLLIDSIQTVFDPELDGAPGTVGQVRECAARFQRFAKETGTTVFLVGHVTKGGGLAGPKTLEHIVDSVLYFETAGGADHRILRATKNRFGSVSEMGVFRMSGQGLIAVDNPSELFLGDRSVNSPGAVVTSTLEGTRPVLLEIQALTAPAPYGAPQRVASGFDHKRLALLLAVLEKRAGAGFGQSDVFLNVVGGLRITEPAADAAVAVALLSAARDYPVGPDVLVLGEVGLGGEIRAVQQMDRRIGEAAKMGFRRALVPRERGKASFPREIEIRPVQNLRELLEEAFG